ncbi:MAG: serine/threonine protein kinase, partial [Verrucomicrobiales bacterium]|nr:serine/threonine protein kinase [Verrucomicrobiales bacterium]
FCSDREPSRFAASYSEESQGGLQPLSHVPSAADRDRPGSASVADCPRCAVSQSFQPADTAESRARLQRRTGCRLEIGDTAGRKPARRDGLAGLGGWVAIKEPKSSLTNKAEAFRRFAEEARVTAGLGHPSIAALREHQTSDGSAPIFVMRLVNGQTFAERIRDFHQPPVGRTPHEQRLLWNQLVQSFVKVCEAMVHAHARGVLHRDLKPGNVVVEEAGDPVILDWGMATRVSMCGASLDAVAGTPDYMPPEQADGLADIRSDVFGLGAILYEVLTGRSPHGWSDGARPADWMRIVREAQFQRPRRLRPQAPRALEAICMKSLARAPKDRYQSAVELLEDVRRYLTGERVSAWEEPVWVRAGRWLRSLGCRSASLAQKPQ